MKNNWLDMTTEFSPLASANGNESCSNPLIEDDSFPTTAAETALADIFDRYAAALDSGDQNTAEKILSEYPEIDAYQDSLRGLYLLGKTVQEKADHTTSTTEGASRRLGDFEIHDEIGRGGMGVVYSATEVSLQRQVALKILPFTAVLDPRQVARFRNEAQAAASLHHPNIVPVYSVGCVRGVHYYSMQLIEGQSLEKFVEQVRNGPSVSPEFKHNSANPSAETLGVRSTKASIKSRGYVRNITELGVAVAEAIGYAHERGIVHRDIKPSNLLLDHAGKVWVTDFGLAQCRGNENLTSQGDRIGTARYMSPEQTGGRSHQVDFRTDIYSLGVTLYELLTAKPAFDQPDRTQMANAIETAQPTSLKSLNPSIPYDLETVIQKAISKEPSDRYANALDFASDLRRCINGEPILAKRQSILDRCTKVVARNRFAAWTVCASLLTLAIASTWLATIFYHQSQREIAAAEKAQFYLTEAHSVVDRFSGILGSNLQDFPELQSTRNELIAEGIGYYIDFIDHAKSSPNLAPQRAMALAKLAFLYDKADHLDKAESSYEKAIASLSALANTDSTIDQQYEIAIAWNRLGQLKKRQGEFAIAKSAYEISLDFFQLVLDGPSQKTDLSNNAICARAQTLANLALLNHESQKPEEARTQFQQAIGSVAPKTWEQLGRNGKSTYYQIMGNYTCSIIDTQPEEAEKLLAEVVEEQSFLQQDSTATNSSISEQDIDHLKHLADAQNNLAVSLSQRGLLEKARRTIENAIKLTRIRVRQTNASVSSRIQLATALNTLGEIQWNDNAFEQAEASFLESSELFSSTVADCRELPVPCSRLATVFHNRSLVSHRNQDTEQAIGQIEAAVRLQTKAIELAPDQVGFQELLKSHQSVLKIYRTQLAAPPEVAAN